MAEFDPTKSPHTKSEYTQEQLMELIQSENDPFYFIEKFVKIQHPTKGIVPLTLFPFQYDIIRGFHEHRNCIVLTGRQLGKALPLDTPIPTPTGWTTMGNIRVGDMVIGDDGQPTMVDFATDVMTDHTCYELDFGHGETLTADAEHIWRVSTRLWRKPRDYTTEQLIPILDKARAGNYPLYINAAAPIDLPRIDFVIDPYEMGSFHNTVIPVEYLRGSIAQRIALLQGLMDQNGVVDHDGRCEYHSRDIKRVNIVRELLFSLGVKNKLNVAVVNDEDRFVVSFVTGIAVFRAEDKVAIQRARVRERPKHTRFDIRAIRPTASVPVRCIRVTNASHMFLCGRSMIPTHNTTTAGAYLLWFAMFNPDKTILIAANVLRQALEIMHRIRTTYELCPDYIRAGVVAYNKSSIDFDNGSRIVAQATTSNTGRGMSISLLYVDEMAFAAPGLLEDMWTSLSPTLSAGGKSIITSTPKTDVDMYAKLWKGANDLTDEYGNPNSTNGEGKNGYFAVSATWDKHPDRTAKWAEQEESKIGKAKFLQEHCCQFVSDDETLIDSMTLTSMKYMENPEFYTGTVRWYVEPEPNRTYLVALDPSLGTGGDFAAIQVFMLGGDEFVQIAEWQNNNTPARGQIREMLRILDTIDGELREHPEQHGEPEIFWTVENNSIGEAVLQIIEDTGEDRFPGTMVNEKKRKGQSRRFRKGLNTDNRKKLSACAKLKSLVESERMVINSRNLVTELKNFTASGASYKAKSGTHDDLVSATLLITRMLEVVMDYSSGTESLKERIGDDELFGSDDDAPLPTM